MLIQILIDNPTSWMIPYSKELVTLLQDSGHEAVLLGNPEEVVEGEILCLLSCHKKFTRLHLNKHNLVAHSSDLPKGRGWSPLTWQILEGKSEVKVTLFEAVDEIDAGDIYYQETLLFQGHELLPELLEKQANAIKKLILKFVDNYPNNRGRKQIGDPTYYPKRNPKNSELDLEKSLADQFNLLRVCDNDRYPAFFIKNGIKYFIKIEKGTQHDE
jgi:methionyl-tRNA formyltransferase